MIRGNTLTFGGTGSMDALYAIIALSEPGWTATAAHPVGSYLIAGGKLFRATADITVGTAIRPGTNAAQTTVLETLRDMLRPVQPTGRSPRCDQEIRFDFGSLCGGMSWEATAKNPLSFSDDTTFGG